MINASVRIRLPRDSWVATVSTSYPDATFRLLSGIQTGDTAIELGEVVADDPVDISEAVASHPSIVDHRQLESTDTRSLSKYETTDTALYRFAERSSFPPEFPIVVQDGWYELDFTGTRETFNDLCTGLDEAGHPYELLSMVGVERTEGVLTDRQRDVLKAAVRNGYLEVPRECTLAELAEELDVDPSTVSEIVRRGQARITKRFLVGSQ